MSDPRMRIALLPLVAVTALIGWWAWKQGAYFGSVFYPGAILLFSILGLILAFAPFGVRVDGPARLALGALVAFAAWTLLSTLWSPTRAAAMEYAEHAFLYAALFATGLWIAQLLRERPLLALAPPAIAAIAVGVATVVVLASGTDVSWYLHDDGTLRFPIGYRNADAAFFLICLWPILGLASWTRWRWPVRALAVAGGTVLLELALLCQSRGSLPAFAVALVVYIAFARHRLWAATILVLVALPVLPALPALLEVFRHGDGNASAIPLLRDAARAIGLTALLSAALAAVALGAVQPRLRLGASRVRVLSWAVAILAIGAVVVGGAAFVSRHGGPVKFVDQRVHQFRQTSYPDLHSQGVRFGANVSSDRHDFWRVAADEGVSHPLLGGGAGSFYLTYQLHRHSPEIPHDPHSVEAMAFSELGIPGLVLLALFVAGAALAALRSRRRGQLVFVTLSAAGVAAGAQWIFQSSYDWFWQYPAVTGTGIYLLGVAAGPGLASAVDGSKRLRAAAVVGLIALSLAAVPLFLSDSYTRRAEAETASDPGQALSDLDSAADLNPLNGGPLILRGLVAADLGQRQAAIAAFRRASDREPDYYLPYFFLARELQIENPRASRVELSHALRLNPRGLEVIELEELLESQRRKREKRKAPAAP